jgi:uncharacterized protein YcnI
MTKTSLTLTVAGLLHVLGLGSAQAHVVLQDRSAPAGSYYKAVLSIGHGCAGSPVNVVTVRLPAGFRGAKPMPKPGWTLTITKAALAVSDDVTQVRWAAQSSDVWVQDAWYDEFVLRGQLPDQPGPLWFKVRQDCEQGSIDWAEVPHHGTSTQGLTAPAALLEVLPAAAAKAAPADAGSGAHQH